eukprot:scaffold22070_cov70-Phaeocystis_antarctica.AAC.5
MSHGHRVTPSTCGSNRNRPQTAHSPTGAARGFSPRQRHCPARHSSSEHIVPSPHLISACACVAFIGRGAVEGSERARV